MNKINNDISIFNYLNPNDLDTLSNMSGDDIQNLIVLINDYYITLRDKLGFSDNITFGIEIEYDNLKSNEIDCELIKKFSNHIWRTHDDISIYDGGEISSPVLRNTVETWQNISTACEVVSKFANISEKCGGHIHVGTHLLGNNSNAWLNLIKMWSVYENIIYRFSYGNYLTARKNTLKYAKPVSELFWQYYLKIKKDNLPFSYVLINFLQERRQGINFRNVYLNGIDYFDEGNTVEFRCPNGTLDAIIWQNNINLFVWLLLYCKSKGFNDDLVEKRHYINQKRMIDLNLYNEIYLDQALELCDMIFTSNLDKINFLKQYLKSFEIYEKKGGFPKSKRFTKINLK